MPPCRPGTALLAVATIGVTIVLALRGIRRTAVPEATSDGGALIGPQIRTWYRGLLAPFESALSGAGISPDTLTWAQLGVSVWAGWAFATGCVFLGGWLTIFAGTLDILDGGLARRTGVAGPRGAFVDSVVDRCAEFVTFFGIGVLFRDGWVLGVVALAAFASQLVSYARARAEGLGLSLAVGRAQRPERYLLLGFGAWTSSVMAHVGCASGSPASAHAVLVVALLLLAAISTWTALERARQATRALGERGGA
jgi:CDP-diacylglycerol--glycerol-3-phosphate 3-phosphatidyltransferase